MLGFHTLNARDASYLNVVFASENGDTEAFRDALQGDGQFVREQLATARVDYQSLKNALIPSADGHQAAFIYDWRDHPAPNYAVAFMDLLVPLLRKTLKTSVLSGDLLDFAEVAPPLRTLNAELKRPEGRPGAATEWRAQYCAYFSNLRAQDISDIHAGLSSDPRYGGYLDVTFGGPVRDYLAATLAPKWVIAGERVILSHGGDEPWVSDQDPMWHDLPRHGFDVVSTNDSIFDTYLSYKIEAAVTSRGDADRVLTLAAVTGKFVDVDQADVFVDPRKLDGYLLLNESKLRLMTNIGLQAVDAEGLAKVIREKLLQNYIYDLRFAPDGTPTFAVSAEFVKPAGGLARRLLALKYDSDANRIALVSMY